MLLAGADEIEDQHARDLNSLVLIPMKDDEVKEVVMNDYLICHFGKVLLRKLGERQVPASMHHKLESLASRHRNVQVLGSC